MSEHYVKVDEVEVVDSSSSTALIVLVIAIIAIAIIGMVMWQPWATTPVPGSSSTTIIREKQAPAPDNRPIIVNPPPAATQGGTKIDIHNDIPAQPPVKIDNRTDTNTDKTTGDTNVDANNAP